MGTLNLVKYEFLVWKFENCAERIIQKRIWLIKYWGKKEILNITEDFIIDEWIMYSSNYIISFLFKFCFRGLCYRSSAVTFYSLRDYDITR